MTTAPTSPTETWSHLQKLANQVRVSLCSDEESRLRAIVALSNSNLDESAYIILGSFLLVMEQVMETFQGDLSSMTTQVRLLTNSQVEEKLPPSEVYKAIKNQDTRDLFIEASRYAAHYMRQHDENNNGTEFFSSLYATSMALLLGDEDTLSEPGIVDQIRGWERIDGEWVNPNPNPKVG